MNLATKAKIAKLSYNTDRSYIESEMNNYLPNGNIRFLYVKRVDSEMHIYRHNNDCLIAIAGTESYRDVATDLFFIPRSYKAGYVHSGYLSVVSAIKEELNDTISELFPEGHIDHLDFIGHSLGGNISYLAIDEVLTPTVTNRVTTFGASNGFSKDARRYLQAKHSVYNVINRFDIITMLLGITTGRPETLRLKLPTFGHRIDSYISGLEGLNY